MARVIDRFPSEEQGLGRPAEHFLQVGTFVAGVLGLDGAHCDLPAAISPSFIMFKRTWVQIRISACFPKDLTITTIAHTDYAAFPKSDHVPAAVSAPTSEHPREDSSGLKTSRHSLLPWSGFRTANLETKARPTLLGCFRDSGQRVNRILSGIDVRLNQRC
jgi:hypothetical protein